jgi:predicted 3-demethylubiquinone-9 3-methyltransferase (glyoxalase superfamily)
MCASFQLLGQEVIVLNGNKNFGPITPAISLFIKCQSQHELDEYWDKLLDGGKAMACGWLTDKFGVTWQVVPVALWDMLNDPDKEKSKRAMQAMMKMVKFDIEELREAYEGK